MAISVCIREGGSALTSPHAVGEAASRHHGARDDGAPGDGGNGATGEHVGGWVGRVGLEIGADMWLSSCSRAVSFDLAGSERQARLNPSLEPPATRTSPSSANARCPTGWRTQIQQNVTDAVISRGSRNIQILIEESNKESQRTCKLPPNRKSRPLGIISPIMSI